MGSETAFLTNSLGSAAAAAGLAQELIAAFPQEHCRGPFGLMHIGFPVCSVLKG